MEEFKEDISNMYYESAVKLMEDYERRQREEIMVELQTKRQLRRFTTMKDKEKDKESKGDKADKADKGQEKEEK